jgi:hypothetical protein
MGHRRRRLAAATAVVASTVLVAGLSSASAAPMRVAGAVPHGHISKIKKGTDAATLVDGKTTIRKAKMTVTLPRVLLRVYANDSSVTRHSFLFADSPSWAVRHKGPHPHFGIFPTAHTSVLGFGAIPITADLHLRQVVGKHGLITPINVHSVTQLKPPFKVRPTVVTGLLNVRVSNVSVDEVPLHVGPNCRSVTPMHLRVVGQDPAYNLFRGGPLNGTVTIPQFIGCGTGGDDVDPLLNGTISGPGNPLHLIQGVLGTWNRHKPGDCQHCTPPGG